jgi:beta-galactosidase
VSINLKIYSNCQQVTLYANGKELDSIVSDDKVFIFENIFLQEGMNAVRAVGRQDGAVLVDTAFFNKVAEPNSSYETADEGKGDSAENWFQMPDFSEVEIEEIEITDDVYSTRCTFEDLVKNEETKAVLRKYMGKLDEHPMFAMTLGMTVEQVASMAKEVYTEKMMYMLNKDLTRIKKS